MKQHDYCLKSLKGSWLEGDKHGVPDVLSKAEVVSVGGISICGVDVVHNLRVVPNVVLGDTLCQLANVGEDTELLLEGVEVVFEVLAVTENEGGLAHEAAGSHDGIKEAREGERCHVVD